VPSTEDTQVNEEVMAMEDYEDDEDMNEQAHSREEDAQSELSDSSEDEAMDTNVQTDMERLQSCFPGFRQKYRLIKRIGEGMHGP
jgi:cell division control protein 7